MHTRAAFADRSAAGRELAKALATMKTSKPVVLALPRGGVPVASEIASALGAPLDIILVRKIGVPYQPELAVAAVVNGDEPELVINEHIARLEHVSQDYINDRVRQELNEIKRRRMLFSQGRRPVAIEGRTVIIVDDGIATGASIRAALKALRRKKPERLILAIPVAAAEALADLESEVDDIVCLQTPPDFVAIGACYRDFHQLDDDEVITLLAKHADRNSAA